MLRHLLQIRRFSVSHRTNMRVVPVPVRDDNYAYLLIDEPSNKAAAIDPYDIKKVADAAAGLGVQIVAAITTHHHFDHSGGNKVIYGLIHSPTLSNPLIFIRTL